MNKLDQKGALEIKVSKTGSTFSESFDIDIGVRKVAENT